MLAVKQRQADDVARDYEEDIDTEIAAREHGGGEVVDDDRDHCDRAQPVDLWEILVPFGPNCRFAH